MKRVGQDRDLEGQLAYHSAATYAANFTIEHPRRIGLAHDALDEILAIEQHPLSIWELGCGSADISGPYSDKGHDVVGIDSTSTAALAAMGRWPEMTFLMSPVEYIVPTPCDVIILAEVLEHLVDPMQLVRDWLPLARYAVIGHPLNEPDPPHEPGHIWSFSHSDWADWFAVTGHVVSRETLYPLGNWPEAIIGWSSRA